MAVRDTSVNLIISAKNQATPALETITATLNRLFDSASSGKTRFADLAGALGSVDKAASKIAAAAQKGEAAFGTLNSKVAANKTELASLEKQAAAAAAVLARLNGADAVVGAGRDQSARLAQVKAVTEAYDQLQSQIRKLGGAVAADEGRLATSRSALQELASATNAATEQQSRLRQELDRRTEAQRRANEETRRADEALRYQASLNARITPNVTTPATANGAGFEALAAKLQADEQAAEKLRRSLNPLAAAARDAATEIDRLRGLEQQGLLTVNEFAEAERRVNEALKAKAVALGVVTEAQHRANEATRRAEEAGRFQTTLNQRINPSAAAPAIANGGGFEALAAKLQADEQAAEKLRRSLNPLATATRDAATEIDRLRGLEQQGLLTANEFAEAERRVNEALKAKAAALGVVTESQRRANEETRRAEEAARYQTALNQRINPTPATPATGQGAGFEALAAKLQADEQAAEKLRRSLNPLAAATRDAATEIDRLRGLEQQGLLTANEFAEAERRVNEALKAKAAALGVVTEAQRRANEETRRAEEAARFQAALNQRINPNSATPATGQGAGFEALGAKIREDEQAAARLRAALNPLAAIQKSYNDQIREAIRLRRDEQITTDELKQRITQLRAEAARAQVDFRRNGGTGVGLFGLRPYELTNLGYQVNDLVTQVASGTSVTQALAQQGGQILQILPQIGTKLLALAKNPWALAIAAGAAIVISGLSEVADKAERVRQIGATLAVNVSGGLYDEQKLATAAATLASFGVAASDATAAFRTLINDGVREDRLVDFTLAAQDLSDVTGVKLTEAVRTVSDAFTGSYDSIAKLDDKLNFLTGTEREHIRTLFESGQAQEARTEAFAIFERQQDAAANKIKGPWTEAVRELSGAWQEFKAAIADSSLFKRTGDAFATMARGIASEIRRLRGMSTEVEIQAQIQAKQLEITQIKAGTAVAQPLFPRQAVEQLEREIGQLQRQATAAVATAATSGTGASGRGPGGALTNEDPNSRRAKQAADRIAELELEEELQRKREEGREAQSVADQARRVDLAAQQAFNQEMLASGNREIAFEKQRIAADRERRVITREVAASEKRISDERERAARAARTEAEQRRRGFIQDIQDNGREGIVATARRYEGQKQTTDRASLTDFFRSAGINIDPTQTAWCAAFVNAVLASQNLPTSKGPGGQTSLAARSFLNYGQDATSNPQEGDIVVLRRGNNQAQGHVGFFQGFDGNGNVRVLGGNQGNGVNTSSFKRDDVLGFRRAPTAAQVATEEVKVADRKVEQQVAFNDALDVEARKRQQNIDATNAQRGLLGEALIDSQKQAAVDEAVRRDREKAAKDELEYTAEQEKRTRDLAAAEFEATRGVKERADARKKAATEPVDQLMSLRDALQDQLEAAQRTGDINLAGRLEDQIQGVNTKLVEAIDKAINFWRALGGSEADAAIAKLEVVKATMASTGTQFLMTGRQINESISGGVANAFDRFAQSVAEGKNVFKSLRDAFLQFASDFLRQIASMIIKQLVFNLISGATGGGGVGGGIAGTIGKMFHNGGVVGEGGGQSRVVNPAWFANATRYHTGGVVGLQADEMPAVLRRGEEVLTRGDPRHRANGGSSGGAGGPTKIVNVFDPNQAAEEILRTPAGEKAMLNFVSNNRDAFRSAMGG